MVIVNRQSDLLEIVFALRSAGRFAGLLDSGQQQGNQHGNNGNDDQQLDEGKPLPQDVKPVA
jgi:hypothetical protein